MTDSRKLADNILEALQNSLADDGEPMDVELCLQALAETAGTLLGAGGPRPDDREFTRLSDEFKSAFQDRAERLREAFDRAKIPSGHPASVVPLADWRRERQ